MKQRSTRWMAGVVTVALATAMIGFSPGGALGVSNDELASDFKSTTDGAATSFVNGIGEIEKNLRLSPGNGTITAAEVGAENYQMLVSEIAAIGEQFDAVTTFPSDSYKLALWAIALYAQQYDSNPQTQPIATGVALLFIAAALIFAPAIFKSTGGTMYGPDDATASIDGIVPFLAPALRSFAEGNGPKSAQPLVSAADQQQIRDGLVGKGLAGPALDGITRILTLAAALAVADARR